MQDTVELYLLSIIIPTRNRKLYAMAALKQVCENTSDNIQVVIQDNSDDDSLKFEIDRYELSHRIKYNYTEGKLSFVDNFSIAVENSDGKYLCIIGDDDGINPEIEKFTAWMDSTDTHAVSPAIHCNYTWPGTGISYHNNDNGNLMITDFNLSYRIYDTKKELAKLLKSGGQNYLKLGLVKIYHGIVSKKAMDKVKEITGVYFGGLSPDIYSAVALSLVLDEVLHIDYPLTIPGVCSKSGSGHSSTGRHHGDLYSAPQLKGHNDYKWASQVPKFYSVETLWADSAIAAFKDMKRLDLISVFDLETLSAYGYYRYKQYNFYTTKNLRENNALNNISFLSSTLKVYRGFLRGPFKDLYYSFLSKVSRKDSDVAKFTDIIDIHQASNMLKEFTDDKKISIDDLLKVINRI